MNMSLNRMSQTGTDYDTLLVLEGGVEQVHFGFKKWTPAIVSNNFNKYWLMSIIFGAVNLHQVPNVHIIALKF